MGASPGFLPPDHFNQVFSAHGTIMILFMAMPFLSGLMNIVVPQQIGAREAHLSATGLPFAFVTYERGSTGPGPALARP